MLVPAESHYLDFVARGEGRHTFSETYAQHNDAIHRLHASQYLDASCRLHFGLDFLRGLCPRPAGSIRRGGGAAPEDTPGHEHASFRRSPEKHQEVLRS